MSRRTPVNFSNIDWIMVITIAAIVAVAVAFLVGVTTPLKISNHQITVLAHTTTMDRNGNPFYYIIATDGQHMSNPVAYGELKDNTTATVSEIDQCGEDCTKPVGYIDHVIQ